MVDRYRFAPSPTGFLHVGNARTALFNWLEARRTGAELLLRVEDTDAERNQAEAMASTFATLEWLGLDFDGEVVFQAERLDEHRARALELAAAGQAYWCDCAADDVQARAAERGGPPGYDGHCRDRALDPGSATALRFRVPEGQTSFDDLIRGTVTFDNDKLEDFVLLRSSGTPVFLLANAIDDAQTGITHVVRGEDHVAGTPKYLLILEALGLDRPAHFAHLPMLVNESRKKLSKRRDSVSVDEFRDRGFLAPALVNYLALLGWGPSDGVEIRPIDEIRDQFRLADVTPSPAFFDVAKLTHFNGEYIRALSGPDFRAAVEPFVDDERAGPVLDALAPLVQERIKLLAEAEPMIDFLYLDDVDTDDDDWDKVMGKDPAQAALILSDAASAYGDLPTWSADDIKDATLAVGERHGLKLGKAQAPIRMAVTGKRVGPPLFESLEYLGPDRTLDRMRVARSRLG